MIKTTTCGLCHEEMKANGRTALNMELTSHLINKHPKEWGEFLDEKNKYNHTVSSAKQSLRKYVIKLTDNPELLMPSIL